MKKKIIFSLLCLTVYTQAVFADTVTYTSYTKITSYDDLVSGDTVVITSIDYGKVMGAERSGKNNREALDITFTCNDSSTIVLADTLGYTKLCLTRRTATSSDWLLITPDSTYLYAGTTTSSNQLKETTTRSDAFFTISIDSLGYATIKFASNSSSNILGYYNATVSSNAVYVFSCYKSSSENAANVQIFSKRGSVYVLNGTEQDDDNTETIEALVEPKDTTDYYVMINRAFAADDGWYTLCLPFGLSTDEISDQFGGATFEAFNSAKTNDEGVLSLNFVSVTETDAGVPYMLKPETAVTHPLFKNKTATVITPSEVTYAIDGEGEDSVSFVGVFNPKTLTTDKSQRFVSSDGVTLTYSNNAESKLNALRAYVQLPDSYAESEDAKITVDAEPDTEPEADTDTDSETDGIAVIGVSGGDEGEAIYTLGGVRVATKASSLPKGAYISGGKKFIVK